MVSLIDPKKTALFVMDMQVDAVGEHGVSAEAGAWKHEKTQNAIAHIQALLPAARAAGAHVVHVHHVRYGDARDGPTNAPLFRNLAEGGGFLVGSPGAQAVPGLAPESGDVVVHKSRVSAFHGSDLEIKLAALGVTKILMTGTWTNFSVESTCRYGADAGYEMVLITDATCTMDADWQKASTDYALTQIVEMAETAEIVVALGGAD
jgi:gluconolactonase